MKKYIGELKAWGKLGVLLPLPSTGAWLGAVLLGGSSSSSFSSAMGLVSEPECCQQAGFRQGMLGWDALPLCLCLWAGVSMILSGRLKADPSPAACVVWGGSMHLLNSRLPQAPAVLLSQ